MRRLLKRGLGALALSLASTGAWAQGAVVQIGPVTPGETAVFVANGMLAGVNPSGGGGSGTGPITPSQITVSNSGLGICQNSTGGSPSICSGFINGVPAISTPSSSLIMSIGGVQYALPAAFNSGSGGGPVPGAPVVTTSLTVNNANLGATWANGLGTTLSEGFVGGIPTISTPSTSLNISIGGTTYALPAAFGGGGGGGGSGGCASCLPLSGGTLTGLLTASAGVKLPDNQLLTMSTDGTRTLSWQASSNTFTFQNAPVQFNAGAQLTDGQPFIFNATEGTAIALYDTTLNRVRFENVPVQIDNSLYIPGGNIVASGTVAAGDGLLVTGAYTGYTNPGLTFASSTFSGGAPAIILGDNNAISFSTASTGFQLSSNTTNPQVWQLTWNGAPIFSVDSNGNLTCAGTGCSSSGVNTVGSLTVTNNTNLGGTLGVTGASTLTGNVAIGGALGVTGATTMAALTTSAAAVFGNSASQNIITVTPTATTVAPTITGSGVDTNQGMIITAAGTGTIFENSPVKVTAAPSHWTGATSAPTFFSFTTAQSLTTSSTAPYYNYFLINESMDGSALGSTPITGLNLNLNYGGGTTKGGRTGINSLVVQGSANTDSGVSNFYVGGSFTSWARFSQPGATSTAPLGHIFALSGSSGVQTGFTATNIGQVAGAEFDVGISSGSTASIRSGLTIADLNGTAQGYNADDMLWLYNSSAGTKWADGLMYGDTQGWPINQTTGVMIGANMGGTAYNVNNFAAQWGIDLNQVAFPATGNPYDGGVLRSNGITINGTGTIQQGSCYTIPTTAGESIDCKGAFGTSAAINAGGSGYPTSGTAAFAVTTAYGGVWLISTTAGVGTGISQVSPPSYPTTSTPSNPVATINLNSQLVGTGLTLNITWNTSANQLFLQPTAGGTIRVGTGAFTANGSVAATLTSLGPVGSHTTVQEWFTVTDSAGTVRYIPAY